MDRDAVIEIARSAMSQHKPLAGQEKGYVLHHGLRTGSISMRLLERIGEPIEVERDVLFTAGLFHDIGKGQARHNEVGADMAEHLLREVCSREELDGVTRIIREHNQRPRAAECLAASRVLQDADMIDHCGAQGIWLAFHWNAEHGETPAESLAGHRGKNEQRRSHAMSRLNYEASRRVMDARLSFEDRFFEVFEAELAGRI